MHLPARQIRQGGPVEGLTVSAPHRPRALTSGVQRLAPLVGRVSPPALFDSNAVPAAALRQTLELRGNPVLKQLRPSLSTWCCVSWAVVVEPDRGAWRRQPDSGGSARTPLSTRCEVHHTCLQHSCRIRRHLAGTSSGGFRCDGRIAATQPLPVPCQAAGAKIWPPHWRHQQHSCSCELQQEGG